MDYGILIITKNDIGVRRYFALLTQVSIIEFR